MTKLNLPQKSKTNLKVGLLGGSFNPAHEGHKYISLEAIRLLGLDYVVWLVSPQNPLKNDDIRDSLAKRVKYANNIASDKRIIVSDIEKEFENTYTANTIKKLKEIHPDIEFIWMMGADNMVQFSKWHNWQEIMDMVPVCVFDRNNCESEALSGDVVKQYPNGKVLKEAHEGNLNDYCWYYLKIEKQAISSTELRSKGINAV